MPVACPEYKYFYITKNIYGDTPCNQGMSP